MNINKYSLFRNRRADAAYILFFFGVSASLFFVSPDSLFGNILNVVILAPFVEEFFFRGFMLGSVYDDALGEDDVWTRAAAVIAAVSISLGGFVIMHTMSEYLFSLVYGFYFTLIFLAFRSFRDSNLSKYAIFLTVAPHMVNNVVVYYFADEIILTRMLSIGSVFVILIIWSILIYQKSFTKNRKFQVYIDKKVNKIQTCVDDMTYNLKFNKNKHNIIYFLDKN
jgi:membrane protease YdiL (CAAX protease family)